MSDCNQISEAVSFADWLRKSWAQRVDDPNAYQNLQIAINSYFCGGGGGVGDQNPFVSFLDLAERFVADTEPRNFNNQKETVYNFIWENFLTWQQSILPDLTNSMAWSAKFGHFLVGQVQFRALSLALKNDLRNFSLASTLFRFASHPSEAVSDLLAKRLREFVALRNYPKIAMILDSQLEVLAPQSLFDDSMLRKMTLYLICTNKARTAKGILAKVAPFERTHSVMLFLDSLMEMNQSSQIGRIKEELGVGDDFYVQPELLDSSIAKLPRDLDLPILNYRNMTLFDMKKKVSFLVRCTFGPEAEMDVTTFRELILTFSQIDDRFLHFAVNSLVKFHLYAEALFFVERFSLHQAFPNVLPNAQNVLPNVIDNHAYYQFPLSDQAIFFIDTVQKFQWAMAYILSLTNYPDVMQKSVGMDAEWTGVLPPGRDQTIAILQLALIDRVFILDLENLACHLSCQDWEALRHFFTTPAIQKVAHNFKTDMSMLTKSFPSEFEHAEPQSVVDLETLSFRVWEAMRSRANNGNGDTGTGTASADSNKPPRSLANVAEWVLGQRIPKMFRMSNWGRRPLDRGQLLYAAADAYCLLQIYQELCFLISSQQLQITV